MGRAAGGVRRRATWRASTPECLNQVDLETWLRNPPAMKPMYADPTELEPTDGKYRGMPNLDLTEDQIDQLVAYLLDAEVREH